MSSLSFTFRSFFPVFLYCMDCRKFTLSPELVMARIRLVLYVCVQRPRRVFHISLIFYIKYMQMLCTQRIRSHDTTFSACHTLVHLMTLPFSVSFTPLLPLLLLLFSHERQPRLKCCESRISPFTVAFLFLQSLPFLFFYPTLLLLLLHLLQIFLPPSHPLLCIDPPPPALRGELLRCCCCC